jgi:hypothetical protein
MDYQIQLITRSQIPADIFLCGENDKSDFKFIHLFEFSNGFKIVYGSNNKIYSAEEIIEDIENDFKITTEYNNSPEELQEYYKDEFDIYYKYSICLKIWNYYNTNKQLIQEVIDYYKSHSLSEYENDTEEEDEGIETGDELVI